MIDKSFVGFFLLIVILDHVSGQSVSPKLDFDEAKDAERTSSTVRPTIGSDFGSKDGTGSRDDGSGRTGPKIHGVRVTVDTGDNQRGSKESKESVEITETKKGGKRVGIHTDITFEITGDVDDSNATNSGQKHDKEENDASVPIFKGRKATTTSRPRKPYDPRSHWNPNYSGERRRVGAGDGGFRPHYPHNVPVYPGPNTANGGDIYRGIDSWSNFVPITSVWTTERSYYEPYQPNAVGGYRAPSWKPCYCMSTSDNRRPRDSTARPTSSVIRVVDKLDGVFSSGK